MTHYSDELAAYLSYRDGATLRMYHAWRVQWATDPDSVPAWRRAMLDADWCWCPDWVAAAMRREAIGRWAWMEARRAA